MTNPQTARPGQTNAHRVIASVCVQRACADHGELTMPLHNQPIEEIGRTAREHSWRLILTGTDCPACGAWQLDAIQTCPCGSRGHFWTPWHTPRWSTRTYRACRFCHALDQRTTPTGQEES